MTPRVRPALELRGIQLETYVDVQNLYGRANGTQFRWDGRKAAAVADKSLGIVPAIGINVDLVPEK